jgi:hypothetical protein
MKAPLLGIMALYRAKTNQFEERSYFRKLIVAGRKMGLNPYLFSPEDVDDRSRRILAHWYDSDRKKWVRRWMPFPDIIFDRCRYQPTRRFEQLRQFRSKYPDLLYLNRPLANKWGIFQRLSGNRDIAPHLPETRIYINHDELEDMLNRHGTVIIKPINGTGGRGILRVRRTGNGKFMVQGRDHNRRLITVRQLDARGLKQLLAERRRQGNHLMQEGIDITLPDGRVHDFRALVQKDGNGEWQFTGMACRVGPPRSVTSNLHGGGQAVLSRAMLLRRFRSEQKAEQIEAGIRKLCFSVVHDLQQKYVDMCELALDIAVDREGWPWLLEVNPKPAREIFARLGQKEVYRTAIERPLEYALWLYNRFGRADAPPGGGRAGEG